MNYDFDKAEAAYLRDPSDNYTQEYIDAVDDVEQARTELDEANSYIEFLEAQIKEYKETLEYKGITDKLLELKDALIDMQKQEIEQYKERVAHWTNSYFKLSELYLESLRARK